MSRRRLSWPVTVPLLAAWLCVSPVSGQESEAPIEVEQPPVPELNEQDALDQLEAAYQREFAFLEAQLRDLQARASAFNAQADRDETTREAQIDRVEAEWLGLQSQGERLQGLITEATRELESVDDARTTLEATFLQADSTLEPYGVAELTSGAYLASSDGDRKSTRLN